VPSQVWRTLRLITLSPEARTIWYRIILKKVHCQKSISLFRHDTSDKCSFCSSVVETIPHLLFECPIKANIWLIVPSSFAPHLSFKNTDIYSLVFTLKPFEHVNNTLLLILLFKTLRAIWCHHWNYIISGVPFQPERI
ncbi:hypothetical protein BDB01DRAFT_708651, partial [Pilobolus umbonatus]